MNLTTDLVLQEQRFENKTYRLSETRIEGFVDEKEALKQAVYKRLSTEQYEYPIYSFSYGLPWKELIGEEESYVRAEIKRMIREALLKDDRVTDVDSFELSFGTDSCTCSFQVSSIYGNIGIEKEVQV